jgi:CubicO group peptidase (beta-lactamase class C family)
MPICASLPPMRLAILSLLLLGGCASVEPRMTAAPVSQAGVAFDGATELGSFADGLADPSTGRAITPDDPARIASVSKLVVAVGVMKLVEQRRLNLDSDASQWLGWPLRNPAFPDQAITLRHLLSHTSSLRDHDDQYAIPLGGTVQATLADAHSWDSTNGPRAGFFTYANLNFPVIGSIVERVTGERFDIWMRREVLDPMRIDACFNWPTCSDAALSRAVVLMQDGKVVRDDLKGKQPDCPVFVKAGEACDLTRWRLGENGALFSPQGGLRISVRGLARVGRMLLGGGTLDGVRVLLPQSVDLLLAPQWRFDGGNGGTDMGFYCSYGLASQQIPNPRPGCSDDPLGSGRSWLGHAGEAYGLRSGLWIDRTRGVGVAYFVTGLGEDTAAGRSAFRAAEEAAFARAARFIGR